MSHPCHTLSNPSAQLFWCRHCMKIFEDPIQRWRHSKTCKKLVTINPEQRILGRDGRTLEVRAGIVENQVIVSDFKSQKDKQDKNGVGIKSCYICKKEFDSIESMKEHVKRSCNRPEADYLKERQPAITESQLLLRTNDENVSSQIESLLKAAQQQQQQQEQQQKHQQQSVIVLHTEQDVGQESLLEESSCEIPLDLLANASLMHQFQKGQIEFKQQVIEGSSSEMMLDVSENADISELITDTVADTDISEPVETVVSQVHLSSQFYPDMQVQQEDTDATGGTFIPPICRLPDVSNINSSVNLTHLTVPISTMDHECVLLTDGTVVEGENNILLLENVHDVAVETKNHRTTKKRKAGDDNDINSHSGLKSKKVKPASTRSRMPDKEIFINKPIDKSVVSDVRDKNDTGVYKTSENISSKAPQTGSQDNSLTLDTASQSLQEVTQSEKACDSNITNKEDCGKNSETMQESGSHILAKSNNNKMDPQNMSGVKIYSNDIALKRRLSVKIEKLVTPSPKKLDKSENEKGGSKSTAEIKDSEKKASKKENIARKNKSKEKTETQNTAKQETIENDKNKAKTETQNTAKQETKENDKNKEKEKKGQTKKKPDKPVKCRICDREFRSLQTLQKHNKVPCKVKHTRNLTQKVLRPKRAAPPKTPLPEPKKKKNNSKVNNTKPKLLLASSRRYSDTSLSIKQKKNSKNKNRRKSTSDYNFNFSCCKQFTNRTLDVAMKFEALTEKEKYFLHLEMIPVFKLPMELRPFVISQMQEIFTNSHCHDYDEDICDETYLPPPVLEKIPDLEIVKSTVPEISSPDIVDLGPPVLEAISELEISGGPTSHVSVELLTDNGYENEDQVLPVLMNERSCEQKSHDLKYVQRACDMKNEQCESPTKRMENRHFLDVIVEMSPNGKKEICENISDSKMSDGQVSAECLSPNKYSNNRHFTDVISVQNDISKQTCDADNEQDERLSNISVIVNDETSDQSLDKSSDVDIQMQGENSDKISDIEVEKMFCKSTVGIQTENNSCEKVILASSSRKLNFECEQSVLKESQSLNSKPHQVRNLFDSFSKVNGEKDISKKSINGNYSRVKDHSLYSSISTSPKSASFSGEIVCNAHVIKDKICVTPTKKNIEIPKKNRKINEQLIQEIMVYPPDRISKSGPAMETNVDTTGKSDLLDILAKSLQVSSESPDIPLAQLEKNKTTDVGNIYTHLKKSSAVVCPCDTIKPASLVKSDLEDKNIQIIIMNNSGSSQDYTTDINVINVTRNLPTSEEDTMNSDLMLDASSKNKYVTITKSCTLDNHLETVNAVKNIASVTESVELGGDSASLQRQSNLRPSIQKGERGGKLTLDDLNKNGMQIFRLGRVEEFESQNRDISDAVSVRQHESSGCNSDTITLPPHYVEENLESDKTICKMKSILPQGLSFHNKANAGSKISEHVTGPVTLNKPHSTFRLQGPGQSLSNKDLVKGQESGSLSGVQRSNFEDISQTVGGHKSDEPFLAEVQVSGDAGLSDMKSDFLYLNHVVETNTIPVIQSDSSIVQDRIFDGNKVCNLHVSAPVETNNTSAHITLGANRNFMSDSSSHTRNSTSLFSKHGDIQDGQFSGNLTNTVNASNLEEPRVMVQYIEQVPGTKDASFVYFNQSTENTDNFSDDVVNMEDTNMTPIPFSYAI